MNIRKYNKKDHKRILDIYARSKLDEFEFEVNDFNFLPLEEDEKSLAQFSESDIYVCDLGGIVGFGAVFGAEIRALFVHPDNRGRGFGIKMLNFLLSKTSGTAILYVVSSNHPAKSLYKKQGFQVIDRFKATYNHTPVVVDKMTQSK